MLIDHGILLNDSSLVSCVNVTRSNFNSSTIDCFLQQTYVKKELVVVYQNQQVPKSTYSNVHFVEAPPHLNLGEMRNLAIELTHGDVICQWEDKDFFYPTRLMTQFKLLRENNIASMYSRYFNYNTDSKKLDIVNNVLYNSLMFKKYCFHDSGNCLYSEIDESDHFGAVTRLSRFGKVAFVACSHEYYACNEIGQSCATEEELVLKKLYVEKMFGIMKLPVEVCSVEGKVIFTYNQSNNS